MQRLLLFAALAAAWLSAGCAFATVNVHPPDDAPATPKASGAPSPSPGRGRGREVIVYAPFSDARAESRCGMQMNGWRMDTADVVCDPAPGRWLSDALASALTRDGYRVLSAEAVPGPSTILLHGTVEQLFLEPHDGFFTRTVEGDFSVRLVVTTESGLHAERTFYVKGTDTHIGSFESVFQAAAEDATKQIASAMVAAVGDLLQQYPDIGTPQATAKIATRSP